MQQGADALRCFARLTLGLRMERAWRSARAGALAAARFPLDLLLATLGALFPVAFQKRRRFQGGPGSGVAPQPTGGAPGSPHLQEARLAAERGLGHEDNEGLHAQALEGWQSLVHATPPAHRKVD